MNGKNETANFYIFVTAALVGSSFQARIHQGGSDNTILPAIIILAILFALGTDKLLKWANDIDTDSISTDMVKSIILIIVILSFSTYAFLPLAYLAPGDIQIDTGQGKQNASAFESIEGPVFSPIFPYLVHDAGHETSAHGTALRDVYTKTPKSHQIQTGLADQMNNALSNQYYCTLLLDERSKSIWLGNSTPSNYQLVPNHTLIENSPRTVNAWSREIEYVFVANRCMK
jgi:hypothetical protein